MRLRKTRDCTVPIDATTPRRCRIRVCVYNRFSRTGRVPLPRRIPRTFAFAVRRSPRCVADDAPVSTNRLIELICKSLGKRPKIMHLSSRLIRGFARIGDVLHLPLNSLRLQKLTEDYVVSNRKLKEALGMDAMPYTTEDELLLTLESFKN